MSDVTSSSASACASSPPLSADTCPSPYSTPSERWMESDQSVSRAASTMSPVADDASASYHHMNTELTSAPSPRSRHYRPHTLLPQKNNFETTSTFAISVRHHNLPTYSRQDVPPVNASATPSTSTTTSPAHNVSGSPLESYSLSKSAPSTSNHGSINRTHLRPCRTSTQVFHNTSDLAAHYGIPQFFPPVPRTTPRNVPVLNKGIDTYEQNFLSLRSNYLAMLSEKPTDTSVTGDFTIPDPVTAHEDMQAFIHAFEASPEFRSPSDHFMTSPFDSPYDEFLPTPVGSDVLKSPVLDFGENDFGGLALFDFGFENKVEESPVTQAMKDLPTFDDLYIVKSPQTPALDPSTLYDAPVETSPVCQKFSISPPSSAPTRRKPNATGTRKNITPDALVPVDAPTQPRMYVTPSATSRKEVPAVFAKKRARATAFDEEDELADDIYTLPPNPTEAQLIEAKRRQNTIAARRSRRRKLEHQRELEETNKQLMHEVDRWKARALTCEALLKHHGLQVPQYDS